MPRILTIVAPATLVLAALIALVAGLAYGGGAEAPLLIDPGPAVRWGLPVAKLLVNLGAAGLIGSLALVVLALDPAKPEFSRGLDIAAASAALWTVAAAATAFLTFLAVYQQPISFDDTFGDILGTFLTSTELGQAWLATVLIAAGLTVLCFAVRNHTVVAIIAVIAVLGLIPMASQGHRSGTADHDAASSALFVHLVFASVWLGGLITLALVRDLVDKDRLGVLMRRYSTLALLSFLIVAITGYVSAEIRVESLTNLLTPYGILVLGKVAALVALGVFGAAQRQFFIRRMTRPEATRPRSWFAVIVVAELAFMGIASGLAAALARTATPAPEIAAGDLTDPTPAELLTGRPLPPPVSFENLFTLWNLDIIWLLVAGAGILFYVLGVLRLKRRGDSWPWYRTVLWISGMLLLAYITSGGVNLYQMYLFSSHMLAHMSLGMLVPILLVPGAPITLALRTIHKRTDGSRGPREWIMYLVHSRFFAVLSNPIVASVIFVGSLWIFYFTPIFSWAMTNHVGHQWMIVHFLLSGYLFVQSLIGIDPAPNRPPYPIRLVVLLATMAVHAFFGLAIISSEGLLLVDWYGAMGWDTGLTALQDQQAGGGIAWSVGEIPNAIMAVTIAILWARSDTRESTRYDRKADRDGDAELEEYNRMLADRAARR